MLGEILQNDTGDSTGCSYLFFPENAFQKIPYNGQSNLGDTQVLRTCIFILKQLQLFIKYKIGREAGSSECFSCNI